MATEILASDVSDLPSADIVLADGVSTTLIKRGKGEILIQVASTTGYVTAGRLTDLEPVKTVSGPCTVRVKREATGSAVGVDRE